MTAEEQSVILAQLGAPFSTNEIKWRVTHTSKDGKRGAVIPFADQRAYTDRLNKVVTPSGWTREYFVTTVSNISRNLGRERMIQTGKVLVTCIVTIPGVGAHTGSGEEWADAENAMTSAENLSVGEFEHVLNGQKIRRLNAVPTMKALSALVVAFEEAVGKPRRAA